MIKIMENRNHLSFRGLKYSVLFKYDVYELKIVSTI